VDAGQHSVLPNSPARIAKFRAAVPLFRGRIVVSTATQYLSARFTQDGVSVRPVVLMDATLVTSRLMPALDFTAGMRNALNWQYSDPVDVIDQIPANGRSVFVKLTWRQGN